MKKQRLLKLAALTLLSLLLFAASSTAQTTLNPTADTDTQSDVAAGTNATLNLSQWCNPLMRFDLSSISGTVSNAKLRIYFPNSISAFTLTVSTTSTDTWSEGGTKPSVGSSITTKSVAAAGAGYVEVDLTSHVQSKMSGNKIVSIALSNNLGTWSTINSRQASSNKPQLVVSTSAVAVTGVSVSPTSASINVGSTTTLTATVAPSNATNKTVSWSSSNSSVATVNSSGVVTGVAAGSATITVTTQDGGKTATCAVTVAAPGGTTTLNPTADTDSQSDVAAGTNATLNLSQWCNPYIKFSLSSISGTVSNAKLRIYFPGGTAATTLNVSTTSNDTWTEGGTKPTAGSAITSKSLSAVGAGYVEVDITAHVQSKMSGNKIVSVALSNTLGNWTAINSRQSSSNKPELVVTTSGGGTVAVTGVSVSPTSASIGVGATTSLTATVTPSNATNKTVSWSSSNTGVATVNSSGVVTGVAAGSATITVTTQDGGKTATCAVTVTSTPPPTGTMSPGCNFWNIGWEGTTNFFVSGLDWATTTNPWNPTLITELQQAKMKCLRFMDWNVVNYSCVQNWSQRIPKTANHYNVNNNVPCFVDNYDSGTNTHTLVWNGQTHKGVAIEWQIDLCNRVGADLWINIPATATADFQYQLANLINNQLNSNLKVYVEWANEVWNWGFTSTVYARDQAVALGLNNLNYNGAFVDPWRAYTVYASVRAFEQFERVFGVNSPRVVKVIAGQVGYHWPGYDYNHMVKGDLAALANSTINPNGVTINAYAMAPYMGGQSMAAQSSAIAVEEQNMLWAKNSLIGTNIKLICYEAGADNYPDQSLVLTRDPQQEQLNIDYLTAMANYCQGPINQYCFYGGCWGLKNYAGESSANAPKWRGWLTYWANFKSAQVVDNATEVAQVAGDAAEVAIYPNPSTDVVYIKANGSEGRVTVIDRSGKVVLQQLLQQTANGVNELNVSQLNSGLYFVNVVSGNISTSKKIVVTK